MMKVMKRKSSFPHGCIGHVPCNRADLHPRPGHDIGRLIESAFSKVFLSCLLEGFLAVILDHTHNLAASEESVGQSERWSYQTIRLPTDACSPEAKTKDPYWSLSRSIPICRRTGGGC